ncbi:MAG: hypothetical protein HKN16_06150 [Saprospiraceae bacterium]|nr:hypothetical protein [Saprospiraceae bacterium]
MKLIKFALPILFLFVFSPATMEAQHDLSTQFLKESWVSSFSNPAWVPKRRLHIGLPTVFVGGGISNLDLESLIIEQGDSTVLDFDAVMNTVGKKVNGDLELAVHPLYFSMSFGKYRIGLEYSLNHHTSISAPGDLAKFLAQGNAPYANRVLDLGPNFYSTTFHRFSIPFSYETGFWTFGARASLLKGVASMSTEKGKLDLTSNMDLNEMYVEADYEILSSGLLVTDTSNMVGVNFNEEFLDDLSLDGNTGFSMDLGIRFSPTDKLSLGASVTGIGQIKWDQELIELSSTANATIQGVTFGGLEQGVEIEEDAALDTLVDAVNFSSRNTNSFSTALPKKVYLNGTFWLNDFIEGGAVAYGQFVNGEFDPALSLSARLHASFVAVGLTYGLKKNNYTNLGANIMFMVGPVQLFAATDNILTAFNPKAFPSSTGRLGLALAFGKDVKKKKREKKEEKVLESEVLPH